MRKGKIVRLEQNDCERDRNDQWNPAARGKKCPVLFFFLRQKCQL